MRAAVTLALLALVAPGLAACVDDASPSGVSATAPHAMTTLPENWQVGAGSMRDSQGQSYNVCTLMQTGKGDRRLWLAATPAEVSKDLYIGVRDAEFPDTAGGRIDRRAVLTIDGIAYRPARTQQVGTTLSMSLPAARVDEFLGAFVKGTTFTAAADDLPGILTRWSLKGATEAVAVWRNCIARELTAGPDPAGTTALPPPSDMPDNEWQRSR